MSISLHCIAGNPGTKVISRSKILVLQFAATIFGDLLSSPSMSNKAYSILGRGWVLELERGPSSIWEVVIVPGELGRVLLCLISGYVDERVRPVSGGGKSNRQERKKSRSEYRSMCSTRIRRLRAFPPSTVGSIISAASGISTWRSGGLGAPHHHDQSSVHRGINLASCTDPAYKYGNWTTRSCYWVQA